ncbi:MAG TPA: hypothetical protein DDW65_05300 [Firmicutes bacterium]|nr:hypothetical protein [Bacillota bacterium]
MYFLGSRPRLAGKIILFIRLTLEKTNLLHETQINHAAPVEFLQVNFNTARKVFIQIKSFSSNFTHY